MAKGYARPDPLFLGLDVDKHGALLDGHGTRLPWLFGLGPIRKGCLWETTAVPEIRHQAAALAEHLARAFRKKSNGVPVFPAPPSGRHGQPKEEAADGVGAD